MTEQDVFSKLPIRQSTVRQVPPIISVISKLPMRQSTTGCIIHKM